MTDSTLPPEQISPVARARRFGLGLLVLLVVDLIWVASSELTEFIFKTQNFSKPFFSTYVKTSLFVIYLPGFLVYPPWRDQCRAVIAARNRESAANGYRRVAGDSESERSGGEEAESDGGEEAAVAAPGAGPRSLSAPRFQPVTGLGVGSGTDSEPDQGSRKVRFSRVAEVREMSAREALHANLARLSYAASLRAATALRRAANRLGVLETAQLAFTFTFLWFLGNYSYQAALADTEAGIVNVLSASSCFFTLLLSAVFPSTPADSPTLTKVVSVLFTLVGVVLVSYSDLELEGGTLPRGALWALCGSLSYSAYIVFLRRKIDHEDKLDVPLFFGFVGLFTLVSLWPVFLVLHYTDIEPFQMPTGRQWSALLVNGLVGTVLSELLWLFGCFYTSSLVATLAISITIPLTMFADVLVKEVEYDELFYVGSVPMFLSFFIVAALTHYDNWDPILEAGRAVWSRLRDCCACAPRKTRTSGGVVTEPPENQCLIQQQEEENSPAALDA